MSKSRLTSDERSDAIVAAALPLFASKGFAGVTTKELARAAEVSEALLYKHFPNKEAIYAAILARGFRAASKDEPRFLGEEPSTLSLIQHVHFLITQFFTNPMGRDQNAPSEFQNMLRLVLNSLTEDGVFAQQVFERITSGPRAHFDACFASATSSGDIVPGVLKVNNAFWFMHHLALTLAATRLPEGLVFRYAGSDDAVVNQAVVFVLRGLGMKEDVICAMYDHKVLKRQLKTVMAQ